ncbi:MAG TPA: SRPBCC domain-containing protein [Actinocrinis sp.]|nr:SRPBCC domain-containing protein [Actinocrinis sp.]
MNETPASPPSSAPSGAASLVMAGTEPAVRFERVLAMTPQEVWAALTDPDSVRGWFPCSISAQQWEVGGALTFSFPGEAEFTMDGVVLECDAPRVLAYLWGEETLRFEVEAVSAGAAETRLVLTDELAAPIAARNAAGWHVCLDRLAGKPAAARDDGGAEDEGAGGGDGWRRLFALYSAAFEPLLGPQEGPPAGFEGGD